MLIQLKNRNIILTGVTNKTLKSWAQQMPMPPEKINLNGIETCITLDGIKYLLKVIKSVLFIIPNKELR